MNKTCSKCKAVKSTDLFSKNRSQNDGLQNNCKQCVKEYDQTDRGRAIKKKSVAKYRCSAKSREWRKKWRAALPPEKRVNQNKAKKDYNLNNPYKRKAHSLIRCAIRRGDLIRPNSCSECLKDGKPHAHHDDYNNPLDVRWLCDICHADWHKNNKAIQHKDKVRECNPQQRRVI